jgi:hypothetical protein
MLKAGFALTAVTLRNLSLTDERNSRRHSFGLLKAMAKRKKHLAATASAKLGSEDMHR